MTASPLETYLAECRAVRATGANVAETSYYPALSALLNEVGRHLKPKVRCFMGLKNQGAGMPDGGLFTESQYAKRGDAEPLAGQMPERGVIEVKGVGADMKKLTAGEQVARYWAKYRLVLVTDLREFVLLGEESGKTVVRERHALAATAKDFWELANHPRKTAEEQGERFVEFLRRVMLHAAPLVDPKDVAWFLASYARDARARVEVAQLPTLDALRTALEQALGLKFEGEKGEHFFRSTLVQTLFYGVFAAWVLWHRAGGKGRFEWHNAAWSLHVPMIGALFEQLAVPSKLRPLGLEDPLELAAATLNRVTRAEFFKRFEDRHAVQYFYEPFLEAFDSELRKQLGVWYTPEEIVHYMVRRVDQVLVSELGIADGLADPQVYVLDPCCGTGAYLVETLAVIGERLRAKGNDALAAQRLKKAMTERIFGFEILPAPFVVSHLQIGLLLAGLGAPLGDEERAGVYLTNALTGWEPPKEPKQHLVFPELEAERDAAEIVKRDKPILVILGNPPYNAFAGVAQGEEQDLVEPYKRGLIKQWGIKKFNLDDLYIRFFRLAERRIVERSGRGIVCFISNFSYLTEPSFVVLRQRLLNGFDRLWIDCLNGDSRETGKLTPEGEPDPSVFSTQYNREGIRVGTAIGLFAKRADGGEQLIGFREFWGTEKRSDLVASLGTSDINSSYQTAKPTKDNRFSFRPGRVGTAYASWPAITELAVVAPINGLMEKRGGALIAIDREALEHRMRRYFDSTVEWNELRSENPGLTEDAARFEAKKAREKVIAVETFRKERIRRYALRPFDSRFCYYTGVRPLWNEPRPSLWAQCWEGNSFLMTRPAGVASPEGVPFMFTHLLGDNDFLRGHAYYVPIRLRDSQSSKNERQGELLAAGSNLKANLSKPARAYVREVGSDSPDGSAETAALMWMHALAIGYSPKYLGENADGIRQNWPRLPLPATKDALLASAELGKKVASLLDTEALVAGVTSGRIRDDLRTIAVMSRSGGGALDPAKGDLGLTAGWGHAGKGGVTMPGKGRIETRSASEFPAVLGTKVHDVYLNGMAYWRNVPERVWDYTIGGYQVMKKWLSYRERSLLGRELTMEEADYVTQMARRIAALLLLSDRLDENYRACKANAWPWPKS
ncbi:MAG: type ISP restriction/modification enzyme [Burkholderiales bacterium]